MWTQSSDSESQMRDYTLPNRRFNHRTSKTGISDCLLLAGLKMEIALLRLAERRVDLGVLADKGRT